MLETNYKIYAYTSNPLQIAVLGLFAHLKTRFANFVTGHITRESVRRGLANGITANQASGYIPLSGEGIVCLSDEIQCRLSPISLRAPIRRCASRPAATTNCCRLRSWIRFVCGSTSSAGS